MARARYPVTVTFRVSVEVAERLEILMKEDALDKGDWLRAVVEAALDDWEARRAELQAERSRR